MADDLNPYAPPRATETVGVQPGALQDLRAPSLGLLLLSGSMCLGIPLLAVMLIMSVVALLGMVLGLRPDSWATVNDALGLLGAFVSVSSSLFILRGALCMRRGTRYRTAVIAAILACIPLLSPLIYIGIPFGIWALIVLRRPAVRAAFQS